METQWYQRRWFDYLLYFVLCVMFIDIMVVMLGPIAPVWARVARVVILPWLSIISSAAIGIHTLAHIYWRRRLRSRVQRDHDA